MPRYGRIPRSGRAGRHVAGLILWTGFWLLLWPFPAVAHAPKEVSLSYDLTTKTLIARITHSVSSPGRHYIGKVVIKKDGVEVSAADYSSQPDPTTFSYSYPLEAAVGAVIEVTASCSLFGSRTEKLTVVN